MDAFKNIFTAFDVMRWVRAGGPLLTSTTTQPDAQQNQTAINEGEHNIPRENESDRRTKEARAETLEERITDQKQAGIEVCGEASFGHEMSEEEFKIAEKRSVGMDDVEGKMANQKNEYVGEKAEMRDEFDDGHFFGGWRPEVGLNSVTRSNDQATDDGLKKLAQLLRAWEPEMKTKENQKENQAKHNEGGEKQTQEWNLTRNNGNRQMQDQKENLAKHNEDREKQNQKGDLAKNNENREKQNQKGDLAKDNEDREKQKEKGDLAKDNENHEKQNQNGDLDTNNEAGEKQEHIKKNNQFTNEFDELIELLGGWKPEVDNKQEMQKGKGKQQNTQAEKAKFNHVLMREEALKKEHNSKRENVEITKKQKAEMKDEHDLALNKAKQKKRKNEALGDDQSGRWNQNMPVKRHVRYHENQETGVDLYWLPDLFTDGVQHPGKTCIRQKLKKEDIGAKQTMSNDDKQKEKPETAKTRKEQMYDDHDRDWNLGVGPLSQKRAREDLNQDGQETSLPESKRRCRQRQRAPPPPPPPELLPEIEGMYRQFHFLLIRVLTIKATVPQQVRKLPTEPKQRRRQRRREPPPPPLNLAPRIPAHLSHGEKNLSNDDWPRMGGSTRRASDIYYDAPTSDYDSGNWPDDPYLSCLIPHVRKEHSVELAAVVDMWIEDLELELAQEGIAPGDVEMVSRGVEEQVQDMLHAQILREQDEQEERRREEEGRIDEGMMDPGEAGTPWDSQLRWEYACWVWRGRNE
ncbi:hypothetical protein EV426DRAFT_579057 [Tirmania nivea]|nr:hypothetical protein EV426DRAFT_579057 [Tirmania nivea]